MVNLKNVTVYCGLVAELMKVIIHVHKKSGFLRAGHTRLG